MYYTPAWQLIEERVVTGTSTEQTSVQHVWSPVYIDALLLTDRDLNNDTDLTDAGERQYVMQDANFNVTGLVGDTNSSNPGNQWGVIERYVYDPYGRPTVLDANWAADGDNASDVGNRYLHQGGRYTTSLQLSYFRFRDLHVSLGRWTRQDPLGYVDGKNRYLNNTANPVRFVDYTGLKSEQRSVVKRIWDGIKGIFGGGNTQAGMPTLEGEIGGLARDAAIDEAGRRTGRQGMATAIGAVVTVAEGLDLAAEAASLIRDQAYWERYRELMEEDPMRDPREDPLYRGLEKIRNGQAKSLTPEERGALDDRFN